jgi:hypothetical protein
MTRWIVAGVVVAVLIGLIVMDEMAFEAAGPELAQTPDEENPTPDPAAPVEVVEGGQPERREAEPACATVIAALEAELGAEKRDEVGNALYEQKGLTPAQVAEACTSLEGKPSAEVVARMLELSGVTR